MKRHALNKKILLGSILLLFTSCKNIDFGYEGFTPSCPTKLASEDMASCLKDVTNASDYHYVFSIRPQLTDGSFGYTFSQDTIRLYGGDEISLTHAAYTLLEELGYTFNLTGISSPVQHKSIDQLKNKKVTPKVRWRGIRQHVNFPMDISSYSIEEVQEYLRSLLRLRLNKLTIHSYPGQWYETHYSDSLALAGNFFYGDTHFIYDNSFLKQHIPSNDSIFCIPQTEPLFANPRQRSQFAIHWMQEVIRYAKELGFYVQMSFEPRSTSITQAVRTAKEIQATYPEIDALEMITEETGGWGPQCTSNEVKETLHTYFQPSIATDSTVCSPILPQQSDLNALYTQIGIISGAIRQLQTEKDSMPELKMGIYCSIDHYMQGAYRLARLALPDHKVCIMPSHGSEGTAQALSNLIHTADDLRQTEIYSWIEFDGLMYLYQNSIPGNSEVMKHLCSLLPQEEQIQSLAFNHWRTAENQTNTRYIAESCIDGIVPISDFYRNYAERMGIKETETYRQVMDLIAQGDSYSKINLGNIGFCWMGAWRSGGSYTWMKKENIQKARAYYFEAGQQLEKLIGQVDPQTEAYQYLSFIGNRILCTVIYLDAFDEAVKIQDIHPDHNGKISDEDQAKARQICDKALLIFEQYMKVHAQRMPDRGCEGTLASIWNAPIRGLKVCRTRLGGVAAENIPHSDKPVDAPPLPIFYQPEK